MSFLSRLAQFLLGLVLMAYGTWSAHVEAMRATRSIPLVVVYLALAVSGALLLPDLGGKLAGAMRTGISLGAAGRRAYDGQVVAVEPAAAPEKKDGAT